METTQMPLFPEKDHEDKKPWWDSLPKDPRPVLPKKARKSYRNKEEYYDSKDWKIKRQVILKRDGFRCRKCGAANSLEIHHKTYDRLYDEDNNDLITLCKNCHPEEDRKREHETRYDNGLDTYATKKYGEDWGEYLDPYDVSVEFDEWLERNEY